MARRVLGVVTVGLPGAAGSSPRSPWATAFTHQGHLADGGSPAAGPYDSRCILYDAAAGGAQVGPIVALERRRRSRTGSSRSRSTSARRPSGAMPAGWRSRSGPARPRAPTRSSAAGRRSGPRRTRSSARRAPPRSGALVGRHRQAGRLRGRRGQRQRGHGHGHRDRRGAHGRADHGQRNRRVATGGSPRPARGRRRHVSQDRERGGGPRPDRPGPGAGAHRGRLPAGLVPAGGRRRRVGRLHRHPQPAHEHERARLGHQDTADTLPSRSRRMGSRSWRIKESSTNGWLNFMRCGNAACSTGNLIRSLDAPAGNQVGLYTSIAIGSDGFPLVSYHDETAGTLKVAKCASLDCAGGAIVTTVDDHPVNTVGLDTSLAIGADGLPVISYYDSTAGGLKVVKCVNVNCAGLNTITMLHNPPGDVGRNTAIAVGATACRSSPSGTPPPACSTWRSAPAPPATRARPSPRWRPPRGDGSTWRWARTGCR